MYYVTVRAYNTAGNIETVTSSGQQVAPQLSFAIGSNVINFNTLNYSDNWTDTEPLTVTTSTNASNGYVVMAYASGPLTSTEYGSVTIPNFAGDGSASWANPEAWSTNCISNAQDCGFGYTSSCPLISGSNKFGSGTLFAPYTTTGPGNIIAAHQAAVNGSTGTVSNEQFTITNKVSTSSSQQASKYQTTLNIIVSATY
jgi:hypothetical protein